MCDDALGPWQEGYDAWTCMEAHIKALPADHFQTTLLTQIIEVREALAEGDNLQAMREMNDIISVTLNWMRSLPGVNQYSIRNVAENRAAIRYKGQVQSIFAKYKAKYGI